MITSTLLLSILGLALLDSLNPATTVTVTLILLAAPKRSGLIALSAVLGAASTVFIVGAALFLTAGAASGAVDGIMIALRFLAFGAASVALIISGVRRFKERVRKTIALPAWFSPLTAFPFGVLVTGADLPNAFPYFITIERLVSNDVSQGSGILIILGYTLIYCLPCLILLLVGSLSRDVTRKWLERVVAKVGTGTLKRSIPIGLLSISLGISVAIVPFVLL